MMQSLESSQTVMKANAMFRSHALPRHATRPLFARLTTALSAALALHRSRSRLSKLEPHMLADIGLTADEAHHEAKRAVWDAPAGWLNRE